ncbi:MAG: sulfatase, partial [Verrucomicrobiota bacterium]
MKQRLALGLLLLLTAAFAEEKPSVLFLAVDDLNDYITPLDGHPGLKTPNFERLAKQSVTFANAHCAAPACHPSRVAVMTGVHPIKSGIYRNLFGAHGPRWRHESPALENAIVLTQHFRDHGYFAAGAGKIFHTLQWTPGDSQNDPDAWDDYRGAPLDPISADWPRPLFTKDQDEGFVGKRPLKNYYLGSAPLDLPDRTPYGDELIVEWTKEQLAKNHSQPVFLAVGLFRPHIPFEVPQRYFDLHPLESVQLPAHLENDLDDVRPPERVHWHDWVTENDMWHHLMQGYLASISYVDDQLGQILDALEESPLKDNTIVILWTDHGFHIGEKHNWEKFALWDQTTRTPLFIHAPGVSQDGHKTREPATLTDLYPTLCELVGIPVPPQCTGVSLVPQLRDPTTPRASVSLTSYYINKDGKPSHALSDPQYRYISHGNGIEELYDMLADPHEFTNLAPDPSYRVVLTRFRQQLPREVAPNRTVPTHSPYHRGRQRTKTKKDPVPDIANKPFSVSVQVIPKPGSAPDGVLFSHGGDLMGYAVLLQNGLAHFILRRQGEVHQISSSD